jgi:hypothetical protein
LKRYWPTVVLVLMGIGLFAYIRFFEHKPKPKIGEDEQFITVLNFAQDDARRLEFVRRPDKSMPTGAVRVVLERKGDDWVVAEPGPPRVNNQEAVKQIVMYLSSFLAEREIDKDPKSLATFGLDKPRMTVSIVLKDKSVKAIEIGDVATTGSYYIKAKGEKPVYVVPYQYIQPIMAPEAMIDTTITDTTRDEKIKSVSVTAGAETSVCALDKDKWRTKDKTPLDCGQREEDLISLVNSTTSLKFVPKAKWPKNSAELGLRPPMITVDITKDDNKSETLGIGKQIGNFVYVQNMNRQEIYEVDFTFEQGVRSFLKPTAAAGGNAGNIPVKPKEDNNKDLVPPKK